MQENSVVFFITATQNPWYNYSNRLIYKKKEGKQKEGQLTVIVEITEIRYIYISEDKYNSKYI